MAEDVVIGARAAMEQAKRDVLANLAAHTDTGKMARSVHYRVRPNVASVTVTLSCDDPGASFLDFGTTGPITSTRPGGRLAVFQRSGGPVQYRTSVRGQPATRFFSDVADDLANRIAAEVARKR